MITATTPTQTMPSKSNGSPAASTESITNHHPHGLEPHNLCSDSFKGQSVWSVGRQNSGLLRSAPTYGAFFRPAEGGPKSDAGITHAASFPYPQRESTLPGDQRPTKYSAAAEDGQTAGALHLVRTADPTG